MLGFPPPKLFVAVSVNAVSILLEDHVFDLFIFSSLFAVTISVDSLNKHHPKVEIRNRNQAKNSLSRKAHFTIPAFLAKGSTTKILQDIPAH